MPRRTLPSNRPPTHPGEMLLEEFLKPLGISQVDFARRIGVSYVRLNAVINGRRGATPNTALRLEKATGMDADFWLGLQADWDLWHELQSPEAGPSLAHLPHVFHRELAARTGRRGPGRQPERLEIHLARAVRFSGFDSAGTMAQVRARRHCFRRFERR